MMLSISSVPDLSSQAPLLLVVAVSLVTGLLMVLLFRFTSNQSAIRVAKDQLQAQILAVQLFQDQLGVVLRAYGRIMRSTVRYVRLTLKTTLILLMPMVLLIVGLDRYLGWTPLPAQQSFLVKVRMASPDGVYDVALQLPPGLTVSAPPVHVPIDNEVVWRVQAAQEGEYLADVVVNGQKFPKEIVVEDGLRRISPARWRDNFWQRLAESSEPALPSSAAVTAIEVNYPSREIDIGVAQWNWIIVFFIVSMVAAFVFKKILRIEI
jgi:hypothetical protein